MTNEVEVLDAYARPAESTQARVFRESRMILTDLRRELSVSERDRANARTALANETRENQSNWGPIIGDLFDGGISAQYRQSSSVSGPITLSNANNYVPISLNRILLSYAYMTNGFVKTLCREPVDDAFKGGFEFESGELDPEDLKQLMRDMRRIRSRKEVMANSRSIGRKVQYNAGNDLQRSDISAVKHTLYWGRLYGGAGMIINVNQDPRQELDLEAIGPDTPLEFIPADRWELVLGQVNLFSGANECPFNYYGYPLHVSRVLKVLSNEAPAYIRSRLQGWGMSEIEQAIRPINAFLKFENLIFELMDEAKVDVYRLQGFAATKASGAAEAQLRRTMTAVNQSKNYANALVLDKNDEYEQKQLTFSGLAEMRNQGRMDLAAALRFPLTKLFGDSSTGFGGGQDAMENYNSVVGGVRENAEPLLLEAGILRCQQRFGLAPEDLQVKWKPLRELGGVEEQDCLTKKHTRNMDLFDRNLMTGQETMAAEKQDGVVVIDTEVGQGLREVEPPMQTEHQLGMEAQEAGGKQQMQLAKAKGKGQPARK